MKKLFTLLIVGAALATGIPPVFADSNDSPLIVGIKQITQGPYKSGDLIMFQLLTTGGNPGMLAL